MDESLSLQALWLMWTVLQRVSTTLMRTVLWIINAEHMRESVCAFRTREMLAVTQVDPRPGPSHASLTKPELLLLL